jgi:hypothetical protein
MFFILESIELDLNYRFDMSVIFTINYFLIIDNHDFINLKISLFSLSKLLVNMRVC